MMSRLKSYSWPGNVRELENTIQSLVVTSKENISFDKLPLMINERDKEKLSPEERLAQGSTLKSIVEDIEKQLILTALEMSGGNRSQAAKILDINRRQLYTKMSEYGIL
jgi:DNA-binding NtrC family response regulator